ncbi:hypothetical protein GCM10011324_38390 [Allosediminivita pacifica]|nr:hypothetical protein GCM10011324_38390 [Allosediminivita pacifica]
MNFMDDSCLPRPRYGETPAKGPVVGLPHPPTPLPKIRRVRWAGRMFWQPPRPHSCATLMSKCKSGSVIRDGTPHYVISRRTGGVGPGLRPAAADAARMEPRSAAKRWSGNKIGSSEPLKKGKTNDP